MDEHWDIESLRDALAAEVSPDGFRVLYDRESGGLLIAEGNAARLQLVLQDDSEGNQYAIVWFEQSCPTWQAGQLVLAVNELLETYVDTDETFYAYRVDVNQETVH